MNTHDQAGVANGRCKPVVRVPVDDSAEVAPVVSAPQVSAMPADPEPQNPGAPSAGRVGTTMGIAYAIVALASSAAAVVVPTIREQFDLSLATGAWVITAFVVALAASAPLYGRTADLIGPRVPITAGLFLMALGAVLSAVAPTPETLILSRGLVGAGAGAVPVLGPVIIAGRLTEADQPSALTRMSGLAALSAGGLLLGAVVAEFSSWRVVLALPILSLLLLVPVRRLAFTKGGSLAGLDIAGAFGISAFAVGLNLTLQIASNLMIGAIGIALIVAGAASSIFGIRSHRTSFIPSGVLSRAATWRISIASAAIPAGFFSILIAAPAIFTEDLGASRFDIGLYALPSAIVGILMGPVAARLRSVMALKSVAGLGLTTASAALFTAAIFASSAFGLAVSFAMVAMSFSVGQSSLIGLLTSATPADERGAALAIFMVVFFLGGGVGGTILTAIGAVASLPVALAVIAVLPAIAAVTVFVLPDRMLNATAPQPKFEG